MNKKFLHKINSYFAEGIDKSYKAGIKSIVELNKKNKDFADKPGRLFKIDYSRADKNAIRNFKLEAFTVAGIGSYDLEEEIKKIAVEYQEGNIDKDEFELQTRNKMMEYGIGLGDQPPTGWLETNLNTAITSSISAARWNRLNDPDVTDLYPALQYNTQRDDRVRPEHEKLDGLTLMKDDPMWDTIYPPNDWNCRCYTTPIGVDEMDGYDVADPTEPQREDYKNDVAPDFRRNSAMEESIWGKWVNSQLKDMPERETVQLRSALREYGKKL